MQISMSRFILQCLAQMRAKKCAENGLQIGKVALKIAHKKIKLFFDIFINADI